MSSIHTGEYTQQNKSRKPDAIYLSLRCRNAQVHLNVTVNIHNYADSDILVSQKPPQLVTISDMSYPERTDIPPSVGITSPVTMLPGFQNAWTSRLAKLHLHTIGDLLFFFPRDYQCFANRVELDTLQREETEVSVQGTITEIRGGRTRFGKSILTITLECGETLLTATWFGMPYLKKKYQVHDSVLLSGKAKPKKTGKKWEMT
ncbi:MAG: hypothetical protein HOA14_15095, partial [Planctomycetaceae bacterium]|nr:hypothetical protein [Planctomycetaceae bacterium]